VKRTPWLGALAALLILLLLRLPAHVAGRLAEHACAGQCRIAATQGSVWRGSGRLFVAIDGSWIDLGDLRWRLPANGAIGELSLAAGVVRWTAPNRIEIADLAVPANAVLGQPALALPTAHWQGLLQIDSARLRVDPAAPQRWQGDGQIRWLGAASGLLADFPLGDYRLDWQYLPDSGLTGQLGGGRGDIVRADARIDGHRLHADIRLQAPALGILGPYLGLLPEAVQTAPGDYRIATRLP